VTQPNHPGATAVAPAPPTSSAPMGVQAATPASLASAAPAAAPTRRPSDTPRRLRLLSLGVVVVGIVVGLVGALVFSALAYLLSRAEADTAQLIRVQQIQTNLLAADATATNAFLVGGLEPPAQRAAYDQALTTTGALIARAARAQPADADALAALNQRVVAYAGSIEQARANNRQGLPVGAQYLRRASAQLRGEALPILDTLVATNAERATIRMDLRLGSIFVVLTLLALAAMIAGQVWLASRFKRRINVGMLAASIALLAALVGGTIGLQQLSDAVRSIQTGSFAAVNAAADARIDASNAKSNESLTLIARGSGAAFENAWKASADSVVGNLGRLGAAAPADEWTRYMAVHEQIRALDDTGRWDAAVALATGSGPKSANTAFNAFDARLAGTLDQVSQEASTGLSGPRAILVVGAILTLLLGLAAAVLGRRGVAARLREYR
jgi:hypothetical protein